MKLPISSDHLGPFIVMVFLSRDGEADVEFQLCTTHSGLYVGQKAQIRSHLTKSTFSHVYVVSLYGFPPSFLP